MGLTVARQIARIDTEKIELDKRRAILVDHLKKAQELEARKQAMLREEAMLHESAKPHLDHPVGKDTIRGQ